MRKIADLTVYSLIIGAIALHAAAAASGTGPSGAPSDPFEHILLDQHNVERAAKNVPALVWDDILENEARRWAVKLAEEGVMYHSTYDARNKAGENLWAGSAGRFGAAEMMQAFLNERDYFSAGEFPKVTTTGKWQDVGHYTQIIWADTQRVGCAVATGEAFDFLVCRYWPSGNMIGTKVG